MIDRAITDACNPDEAPTQTRPSAVCVARATPPVHGSDGRIVYAVDLGLRAGKLLEDGSIDLRERNSTIAVTADQEVSLIVHATVVEIGYDVRGECDPAKPGGTKAQATRTRF
jgi:uncharacterized protein (DUF342 family)